MKFIVKTIFFLLLLAALSRSANAAESVCQVIYGGGVVCPPEVRFILNKLVQNPTKGGDFVENLGVNDPKFSPNQAVNFKVVVKNTGQAKLTNIRVEDTLPQFLNFVSGPGNFNSESKILTLTIDSLEKNLEKEFIFTARVVEITALPVDVGIVCPINQVRATDSTGASATDSTQLCVEKPVLAGKAVPQVFPALPIKAIPPTGPEAAVLPLLASSGILGWFLRKKSNSK